jgi:hypothetical protein
MISLGNVNDDGLRLRPPEQLREQGERVPVKGQARPAEGAPRVPGPR